MRRWLTSLALMLFFLISFAAPVSAQGLPGSGQPGPNPPLTGGGANQRGVPEIELLQESQIQAIEEGTPSLGDFVGGQGGVFNMTGASMVTAITGGNYVPGPDGTPVQSAGLLGNAGHYMAMFYSNPPADTQTYVADVLNSAGVAIAQPAYAQGIGFTSLNPILQVWKTFRNVAYFFFVVIFIVIGFMIMFRQRIGSQTVVTAQQAIPQVIVALLAVTFSYAIAGLMIDLMYVVMNLLVVIFGKSTELYTDNIFGVGFNLWRDNNAGVGNVFDTVANFISQALQFNNDGIQDVIGFLGGLTFAIIFSVAMLIAVFRIFFELLRAYISLILSIAFAPIILMLGAIPGRSTFGGWVRSLVANLVPFPVLLIIIIIFYIMSENISDASSGFLAPYLIGQGNGNAIATLISLGLLLIAPDIIKQAQKAIGGGGGVFEQLIGQNLPDAIKKGWTGDAELIPGVGASNLSKSPLTSWFGGISGQNAARKVGGIGVPATAAIPIGAGLGLWRRGVKKQTSEGFRTVPTTVRDTARNMGTRLGDPNIKQPTEKKDTTKH